MLIHNVKILFIFHINRRGPSVQSSTAGYNQLPEPGLRRERAERAEGDGCTSGVRRDSRPWLFHSLSHSWAALSSAVCCSSREATTAPWWEGWAVTGRSTSLRYSLNSDWRERKNLNRGRKCK